MEIIRTAVNMPYTEWISTAASLFAESFEFVKTEIDTENNTCYCYLTENIYILFEIDGSNVKVTLGDNGNGTSVCFYNKQWGECNLTIYKSDSHTGAISVGSHAVYSNEVVLFFGETTNILTGEKSMGAIVPTAQNKDTYFNIADGNSIVSTGYNLSQVSPQINASYPTQIVPLVVPYSGVKFDKLFLISMSPQTQVQVDFDGSKYLFTYKVALPAGSEIKYVS